MREAGCQLMLQVFLAFITSMKNCIVRACREHCAEDCVIHCRWYSETAAFLLAALLVNDVFVGVSVRLSVCHNVVIYFYHLVKFCQVI